MDKTIGVRMPDWMVKDLDALATSGAVDRSTLVRIAIMDYLGAGGTRRGRHALSTPKGSGRSSRRNAPGRK